MSVTTGTLTGMVKLFVVYEVQQHEGYEENLAVRNETQTGVRNEEIECGGEPEGESDVRVIEARLAGFNNIDKQRYNVVLLSWKIFPKQSGFFRG
jgi:hypothetical protein